MVVMFQPPVRAAYSNNQAIVEPVDPFKGGELDRLE
jgi:hypothetical protein